ncbi:MAG: hypothetical protein M5U15_14305 [Kiritimatiellae bacterium]|nr:hypothetical protein [Kiritimatiellia bacterium]
MALAGLPGNEANPLDGLVYPGSIHVGMDEFVAGVSAIGGSASGGHVEHDIRAVVHETSLQAVV